VGTETNINKYLSRKLRTLRPKTYHIKIADKYTIGISDFLIWHLGCTIALEMKYIDDYPSEHSKLLTHIFTGSQLTFLEDMELAQNISVGGVCVNSEKRVYIMSLEDIPPEGNWITREFRSKNFWHWDLQEPKELLEHIVQEYSV